MSNEKEDLKDKLQSIKENIEKKLSDKERRLNDKQEIDASFSKDSTNRKKEISKKKKPIPISVGMEVVKENVIKKEVKKGKEATEKRKIDPETTLSEPETIIVNEKISINKKTVKKKKKKKKSPILAIALLVLLLGVSVYLFLLQKDIENGKDAFNKEKNAAIDYNDDVYFKEVEDEPDDEEMQDFAVYKDVPEVVASNNSNSEVLSDADTKNIENQIIKNKKEAAKTEKKVKNIKNVSQSTTQQPQISDNQSNEVSSASSSNKSEIGTAEKSESTIKSEIKKEEVFSDMIKVVGLQHKDGSFSMPKKAKKTNAFKVRVRLKKNQISKSEDDVNIMLVVKNNTGNTIKIDSKKVNFRKQNSKVLYLEFYEIFPDRLNTNTNYSFSVFANKKLIKSYRKSI